MGPGLLIDLLVSFRVSLKHDVRSMATLCFLLMAVPPVLAEQSTSEKHWQFEGTAYLWGAGIGGTTVAGDDIDISFEDIISNLDMAFMGTLAARKNRWTLFADLIYKDVSEEDRSTANIIGFPVKTEVEVELKGFIATFGAAYQFVSTDRTKLSAFAGGRYLHLETDLEFDIGGTPEKYSDSGAVLDGILGVSGQTDLNEDWYLSYYLDGGTGESDFTWQAELGINKRLRNVDIVAGYRYLEWQFDDDDTFDELNVSGPYIGTRFFF